MATPESAAPHPRFCAVATLFPQTGKTHKQYREEVWGNKPCRVCTAHDMTFEGRCLNCGWSSVEAGVEDKSVREHIEFSEKKIGKNPSSPCTASSIVNGTCRRCGWKIKE